MAYHFIMYLLDINNGSTYCSTEKVILMLQKKKDAMDGAWGVHEGGGNCRGIFGVR
jgi:hypothetical protein